METIVGLYVTWGQIEKALTIKWIENSIGQSGDHFDAELVKAVGKYV